MNLADENKIKSMARGGKILAQILQSLKNITAPGVSTFDLEEYAIKLLAKYNVKSAFLHFHGYNYTTCISINDEIVHGLPDTNKIIKDGDLVSIDCGVKYNGYCTDAAISFSVGKPQKNINKLLSITKQSLDEAIKLIKPGEYLGTIQAKIAEIIRKNNLGLVMDLTGHGIGRDLQEEPQIPNYGTKNTGLILKPGMTFCLEPMVTLGSKDIKLSKDGWTIRTLDHSIACHFEHTIAVTDDGCKVLTKI